MKISEGDKLQHLNNELQVAALNLIRHLRTNHVRMRIEGTVPELYITLSEGRHAQGAESQVFRAEQVAYVAAVQDHSLFSFLARLRKPLAA